MKRRVISFMTGLALCLSLCPMWALADSRNVTLTKDTSGTGYTIAYPMRFDLGGYTYTASNAAAISIQSGGSVYLTNGTVKSGNGAGAEVNSGGTLSIEDAGVSVIGTTYGLYVSSGATVQLSGGTFTATGADGTAIYAEDGYASLLVTGYAFFDEGNAPIPLTEVAGKTVTVQKCTNHLYSYKARDGAPSHDWECLACGAKGMDLCTFNFDENDSQKCDKCDHVLKITIDPVTEVYDGESKPSSLSVKFELDGNEITLTEVTDYTVNCTSLVDVGETLVTVTGVTYHGTFKKTFCVTQAQPVITWDVSTKSVDYDGSPVEKSDLPGVSITGVYPGDLEALKESVRFSYKKTQDGNGVAVNEADFTDGLPTDAGTYEIKASLQETQNYCADDSDPNLILTINKIDALKKAPEAVELVYNKTGQKLVTGGMIDPGAVGAVIEFAASEGGPWVTDIPTGTDARDYEVWYKIDGTGNYNGAGPTKIENVKIQRKPITPVVELEYTTCVYDGGEKKPAVTVRDKDDYYNPLPSTEYEVAYSANTSTGTAAVTVSDKDNGNYNVETTIANFEITAADQDALTITNKPNAVAYGDKFTLSTSGGSGDGDVTWEITSGNDFATVNADSGQVTVTGLGSVTVRATKSDGEGGNHKDATAQWTFTVGPKRVTATVTASSKIYDGGADAGITAVVEKGDLVAADKIEIKNVKGTFSDANVGTNKTVTVDIGEADIEIPKDSSGNELYIVTIPTTPVRADIIKATTSVEKGTPTTKALTYSGDPQTILDTAAVASTETGVPVTVEYALSESGTYSTVIPKATDAGTYEVWYRVRETDNYFGTTAESVQVTIAKKSVTAYISLSQIKYAYDGKAKEPAVTVRETDANGKVISPSEYTVAYSNNTNAGKAETAGGDGTETTFDVDAPAVTVTAKEDGNYQFDPVQMNFEITAGGKASLTKSPLANSLTYNGQEQKLVTAGEATGGQLVYAWIENNAEPTKEDDYKTEIPTGKEAGLYKVYYKIVGNGNYEDSGVSYVFVTIQPKTVSSPAVTLPTGVTFTYTGSAQTFGNKETEIIVKDGSDVIPQTEYSITYSNNVNAGTATVHINDKNGGNYDVSGSAEFEIAKAAPTVNPPTGKTGLQYNGAEQALITRGSSPHGTMVYSLDGKNYFEDVPTAVAVKDGEEKYTVYYKVLGDSNHNDYEASVPIEVSIAKNTVTNPTITLSSTIFWYNGSQQKPAITVRDDKGLLIPENEYVVTFSGDSVAVGTYTITITAPENSNYVINGDNTRTYEIVGADQQAISITGMRDQVYYGDTIQLGITGGTGEGTVTWSVTGTNTISSGGQLTIKEVGPITVTAKRTSSNYNEISATWEFYANKKPVTAVVTGVDKVYDGTQDAIVKATVNPSDLVSGDSITIDGLTGKFADEKAGTNKTITVDFSNPTVNGTNSGNYAISYPDTVTASITPKEITPTITVADGPFTYTGTAITPDVTVSYTDTEGTLTLQSGDYIVEYSDNINAGTATVTVKNVPGGNYTINVTEHFKIDKATPAVSAPVGKPGLTYTGAAQALIFSGSTSHGQMMYSLDVTNYSADVPTGTAADTYTVYYKVPGDSNHNEIAAAQLTVTIDKADQNPLTIIDKPSGPICYDDHFTLSTSGGSGSGAVTWEYSGDAAAVDSNGLVTVTGVGDVTITATKAGGQNYNDVSATWTFTAEKATPTINPEKLTVSCTSGQKLTDIELNFTANVAGSFAWVNGDTEPENGKSYDVVFTPEDTVNYNTVTIQVTVTFTEPAPEEGNPNTGSTGSGTSSTGSSTNTPSMAKPGTESPSTQTSVRSGTASTVLNSAAGDALVDEAVANQSENVVIKPEITGDVTKTEVSIPASAVSRISSETNAALTISTPVADVTILNSALGTLSGASGSVSIVTERVDNSVVLALTADGKDVGDIPLTLTVPVKGAGSGTVAVLVYEDGTRETIRKSVVGEDGICIPLNGSAVVEIVDNSKEFTDVSAEHWAADAVAFASAHELFTGTAEATFSPELSISRAMLATVLHNLEGNPDQSLTDVFNDIGNGAWYEESVSWAAANGIVLGYGSGQFGPNDSITREQIAVMLWRYAGSPVTDGQMLDFVDADQVSGYAMDAMYWATANGILNGFGNGYLAPGGLATRAQAAQMMKNFLENI